MSGGISSLESKVWFDVKTNEPIFVDPFKTNHSKDAFDRPEKYRLPKDAFKNIKAAYDYDGYVLFTVMQQGYVRIMLDYKDPQYGCNAEGVSLRDIQKAVSWLEQFVGGLKKIIIVVRKSEGEKDGDAYILDNEEKIDFFIKFGKILRNRF